MNQDRSRMPPCLARWACAWLVAMAAFALPARAQILSGPWVQQQDQRIEEHRKGNLRVIVLDAQGRPVPNAQVHLAMQKHAFLFGVRLSPESFRNEDPPKAEQPIWRLLNSVAIEELADRVALRQRDDSLEWDTIDAMLQWSRQRDLAVRWGSIIPSDLSRLPAWVARESNASLPDALDAHVTRIASLLGGRAAQWDVLTGLPDQAYLQDKLGPGIVRRLFAQAQMHSPDTPRLIRFSDTLAGPRLAQMVETVGELRDAQVPLTGLSMDIKLGGNVAYVSLERSLEWIGKLNLPVSIVNLEVGGPTPSTAAVNLETTLRTLFSYPFIQGIWLTGLRSEQTLDPSSAMIDSQGLLTPSGELFERLAGRLWWTDEVLAADSLGNVRSRVFAGAYLIHAAWPGGQAKGAAWIPPGKQTQLVIVQQLRSDASPATAPAGETP